MSDVNKKSKLGELLLEQGALSRQNLNQAILEQKERKHAAQEEGLNTNSIPALGELLIELGLINKSQLKKALGWQKKLRKTTIAIGFLAPLLSPFSLHAGTVAATPISSQVISSSDASHKLSAKETQDYAEQVQAMYVAYYGRPGDAGGVNYWAGRIEESGGDLGAIINQFGNSAEYTDRLAGKSSEELINNIYLNLFGRDADAGGLTWYKNRLESGAITLASIALNIANGVEAGSSDAVIIENKIEVANAYTDNVTQYGEAQIDDAIALLAAVTSESDSTNTAIESIGAMPSNEPSSEEEVVVEDVTETPVEEEVVTAPVEEEVAAAPAEEEVAAAPAEEEVTETPNAASKSISVSWSIPDSRENGDMLYAYEIGGYEILYKKDDETLYTSEIIEDSLITSFNINDLSVGDYEVKIASFDTDNLLSEYQTVSVSIQ